MGLGTLIVAGGVGVAVAASGGGAAAAAAAPSVGFVLAGVIALGQVNNNTGLVLEAFKADGTALQISSSVVDATGAFTITVTENYAGPVLLRLKDTNAGTNYVDEGTGVAADITTDLRAVVNVSGSGGATITVAITPLTELAVRELLGDAGGDLGTSGTDLTGVTTAQVTAANDSVKTAFGLTTDIVTTTPVTVDNAGFATATAAQQAYGHALAAVSGMEVSTGQSTGVVLNTLSQNLTTGTLGQSAVDKLLAGAAVVDGVVGNAGGTVAALTPVLATNISAITITADTGTAGDFITGTAAQTIGATLDAALSGTKLWGSLDNGATWADISASVAGTTLTWNGVTLAAGVNVVKLAVTPSTVGTGTVPPFTGAAADLVTGTKISVQNVALDTTAPAFGAVAANFAENGTGVAYASTVTDAHLVTYSALGGADAAKFTIDPNSGAISFVAAPNFEAPLSAATSNVYTVNVTATDGAGNATTQAVTITVTDVNEMPTVTSGTAANFLENATGTVYTATATDPDTGAVLTYALGGADAALFNINATSGAVTFKAAPNFEAPADAGANNVYDITVTASDGTNTTAAKAVAITVTNVNEMPTITSAATASFAENGTGTVYTATATDQDTGTTLTYALGGTDAARFNINGATGAVTFAASPNFEIPNDAGANNVYNITVTASDGTNTTAAQAVAITVTDVNEAPTVVTQNAPASLTLPVNQVITTNNNVSAMFADVDANTTWTYSATGLPAGVTLNPTTGLITGTPTTTVTAAPVVITASDGALSVSHSMTVSVVTAPVISSIASSVAQANNGDALTFTATFSEAVAVTGAPTLTLDVGGTPMTATYSGGTGTNALTFTATTPATGTDSTVTVTAITLGGGATVIGNTTGQPLVTATVGQVVPSFVVDNTAPTFSSAATANAAENQTAAYTAAATDNVSAVTYSLTGGADMALFNINANSGAVTFKNAPNFEVKGDNGANNVYDITVTATDALGNAANKAVAITVTNVNENPALTGSATSSQTVVVGQAFSSDITPLFTDVDGDTLTYTTSALPTGITINAGVISGTPAAAGVVPITITATDAGGLFVSHTVTVTSVAAPTLTSSIDNVANFDVSSNIVLTASSAVTAVAGKYIHIINDGGTGFHGEATLNTQDILVTDTNLVNIVNNTITINPGFDLDLANNYHITVDAGAFLGNGLSSVAVSDAVTMNFSTVTPGTGVGGVAGAAASQKMVSGTDAMAASYSWWDVEGLGSTISSTAVDGDLAAGNIAVVFKDYDPAAGDVNLGYAGVGSPGDDWVNLLNFGNGDLLYIDNQTNAVANDLTQSAFNNNGVSAPIVMQIDGYAGTGGFPTSVGITTTQGASGLFSDVAGLQSLLSLTYVPIVSA